MDKNPTLKVFILYMLIFCTVIFIFTLHTSLKLVIFYFLFICIFSDIGGLLFGKLLKGPKLISISPKKTISGSIGSFTLPFVFSTITFYSFNINFFFKEILILTFLISLASQIGDIFFSYLKRKAKLKDTGKILPGHGGILDRIDGLLLGIPVGLFYLYLIN